MDLHRSGFMARILQVTKSQNTITRMRSMYTMIQVEIMNVNRDLNLACLIEQ